MYNFSFCTILNVEGLFTIRSVNKALSLTLSNQAIQMQRFWSLQRGCSLRNF